MISLIIIGAIPCKMSNLIASVACNPLITVVLLCAVTFYVTWLSTVVTGLTFQRTVTRKVTGFVTLVAGWVVLFAISGKVPSFATAIAFYTTVTCKVTLLSALVAATIRPVVISSTFSIWAISGEVAFLPTGVALLTWRITAWTISLEVALLPTTKAFRI